MQVNHIKTREDNNTNRLHEDTTTMTETIRNEKENCEIKLIISETAEIKPDIHAGDIHPTVATNLTNFRIARDKGTNSKCKETKNTKYRRGQLFPVKPRRRKRKQRRKRSKVLRTVRTKQKIKQWKKRLKGRLHIQVRTSTSYFKQGPSELKTWQPDSNETSSFNSND